MPLDGYHEAVLVGLSVVVAIFASYTALDLAGRIPVAGGAARFAWTAAAAVAMGGGIWSMHFVAMLAFRLPVAVRYDLALTALSAVVAMAVTGFALYVCHEYRLRWWRLGLCGTIMGVGIAAMHYIGMAAMEMPGCTIAYRSDLLVLSIVIAIVAATAALWLVKRLNHTWERLLSASVMGGAICAMHYTGMAAAQFFRFEPAASMPAGAALSPTRLGVAVAGVTGLLLCLALISTSVDRRLARSAQREAEALRRAKDMAESANRAKDLFLAVMSHELRTPLNAILGFSEIIRDQRLGANGAQYADYAGEIHRSGCLLRDRIEDILDMTRVESGKLELAEEQVELTRLLASCCERLAPVAAESDVKLERPAAAAPVVVWADRRRLTQIFFKLVDNAIKFSPKGGRVRMCLDVDPDETLRLHVVDEGPGIAPDEQSRIFDAFVQLDDSALTRRHEGLGLGLPLARAFADLHGGRIEIASTAGAGSRFTFVLPAARVLGQEESSAAA